jgi:hypothetical protein
MHGYQLILMGREYFYLEQISFFPEVTIQTYLKEGNVGKVTVR